MRWLNAVRHLRTSCRASLVSVEVSLDQVADLRTGKARGFSSNGAILSTL